MLCVCAQMLVRVDGESERERAERLAVPRLHPHAAAAAAELYAQRHYKQLVSTWTVRRNSTAADARPPRFRARPLSGADGDEVFT